MFHRLKKSKWMFQKLIFFHSYWLEIAQHYQKTFLNQVSILYYQLFSSGAFIRHTVCTCPFNISKLLEKSLPNLVLTQGMFKAQF